MTRRRSRGNSAPVYRLHKGSGQAVVTLNGKVIYLGKYGSDESHERYRRLIAEQWSNQDTIAKVRSKQCLSTDVTVAELAIEYARHAKGYYRKKGRPTSEWQCVQRVLKQLRSLYGSTAAADFGPVRYQTFRQVFIDEGLARTTINHYMFHVRRMFQHAGKLELVPMEFYWRLKDVGNLLDGRSNARETDDILPVDDVIVDATILQLTPVLSAMVKIQQLTGMRPGEVTQLRPCDVDRSGAVWIYRPPIHKNQHKKSRKAKTRIVMIGPNAQKTLTPYLLRDHQAFCFCPAEGYQQHQQQRAEHRSTPINQGNRTGYNSTTRKRQRSNATFQPCYTTNSYRQAIQRAALRAFPSPDEVKNDVDRYKAWKAKHSWSPNQLRHAAATLAREKLGLETAQQVCGHTQVRTTENVYAEIDTSRAVEFARKYG